MGVFTAVAALALWGFIGQRDSRSVAEAGGVRMVLEAPEKVRGGLYFQSTVEITTQAAIESPRLVLDEGWFEGMQVNSIEPAAESEVSRDGRVVLTYAGARARRPAQDLAPVPGRPDEPGPPLVRRRARRRDAPARSGSTAS